MKVYINIMDHVNKFLRIILFICLFITLIALGAQVVLRFVFSHSLSWTEELSRYLIVWMAFIGAGVAVRHNKLIKIQVLLSILPEKVGRVISIIAGIISIVFFAMLIYFGFGILETVKSQHSSGLEISMAIPYLAIPVGGCIMLLNAIASIFDKDDSMKGELEL